MRASRLTHGRGWKPDTFRPLSALRQALIRDVPDHVQSVRSTSGRLLYGDPLEPKSRTGPGSRLGLHRAEAQVHADV
jgi:hypothetical protein